MRGSLVLGCVSSRYDGRGRAVPQGGTAETASLTRPSDTLSPFWKGERVRGEEVAHLAAGLKPRPSDPPK